VEQQIAEDIKPAGWTKAPTLLDLKKDFEQTESFHAKQIRCK
jgi:hypothetical protein